jgi:hypothetical protein
LKKTNSSIEGARPSGGQIDDCCRGAFSACGSRFADLPVMPQQLCLQSPNSAELDRSTSRIEHYRSSAGRLSERKAGGHYAADLVSRLPAPWVRFRRIASS